MNVVKVGNINRYCVYVGNGKVIKPANKEIRRRASHGACALIESDREGPPMVAFSGGHVPIPAKCSSQLQKLIQEYSVNMPPPRILDSTMEQLKQLSHNDSKNDNKEPDMDEGDHPPVAAKNSNDRQNSILSPASSFPPHSNSDSRPIYPHLPYSPYGSPATSPRVRRKPLRETTRVNSINDQSGEFVQLNQYKVEGAIGQVILFSIILLSTKQG